MFQDPTKQEDPVAKIEQMLEQGMDEQQIMAAFGLKPRPPAAPPPGRFDALKGDLKSAARGAAAEAGDIFEGFQQQFNQLEDASWTDKIKQAVRTGTYGPMVDGVKGILGLGGNLLSHGAQAVQGNPEAGGRALVDAALALTGARGLRGTSKSSAAPQGLSFLESLRVRAGGTPSGTTVVPAGPSAGISRAVPSRPRTDASPPPIAPSLTGRDVMQASDIPNPMPPYDRIGQLHPALRMLYEEQMQGIPSPSSRPFMANYNPEFPFRADEFTPNYQSPAKLKTQKKRKK